MDIAKREPEIEEKLLRKQEEAQREPNPAKSDSDATRTTLEEKIGNNRERRRKVSYQGEEKAYERRRGSYHNSESGKKVLDKRKGPYHY